MEIGSFLELDLRKGSEYYKGRNVARLNSARAGIYHAARLFACESVCLPRYQCDAVRNFLLKKSIRVSYYQTDDKFTPCTPIPDDRNTAMVFVNYFGVMGTRRMSQLAAAHRNVIIDNAQAFFAPPVSGCMNVYSPRKFIGVPDGCYVVGTDANTFTDEYERDASADTSLFLLSRIEKGCEAAYGNRMENERRIGLADIRCMSRLTSSLLDAVDYLHVMEKRRSNFEYACNLFRGLNRIDPKAYWEPDCVPMVYPLLIEDEGLADYLIGHKIFLGHWWSYLLDEIPDNTFEARLSRYLLPLPIDQRYGKEELLRMHALITAYLNDGAGK